MFTSYKKNKTMKKYLLVYVLSLAVTLGAAAQNNFTGRWIGTYGTGTAEGPNYFSIQFDAAGTIQLFDAANRIIANGTYTSASGKDFTATYSYVNARNSYSVSGSIVSTGVMRGTWGSGTKFTGGGQWVMNKSGAPAATTPALNRVIPTKTVGLTATPPAPGSSSVYNSAVKIINVGNGRSIRMELKRNPNTGSDPVINKVVTQNLPPENTPEWNTEVKKVYLSAESTTFMNASNNSTINIVPGAIYTFEDFMGGANNEIIGNRNPIRIYTGNTLSSGGTGGVVINNPSGYEISQGNGGNNLNIIRNSISQSTGGSDFFYRSYTCNSEAELVLKVTAGGSYSGFSASAGYGLTQNKNKFFLTVDAVKPMYTIKAEKPTNGFFSTVNPTANKIYVKEVTYGSRVLANVEITLENREDIANFKASYESGGFSANAGMNFISKNKTKGETLNAMVIGAPITVSSFNKDNLENEIKALLATCTFANAKPISYTLGDMDGNTIATKSATDEIIERNSIPANLVYTLDEAALELETGADNKEWQSGVKLELFNGKNELLMYQPIENSKVEYPINDMKLIGLNKNANVIPQSLLYDNIKASGGFIVKITYYANIFTDAWKIDGVKLRLKFIDQNRAPYPSSANSTIRLDGSRGIPCANATQILDGFDRKVMYCYINGNFTPTTSTVGNK